MGESTETIESLSQSDELYFELPNCAEVERKQGPMSSEMVLAATQSVLGDEVDEDMKPVEHLAKSLKASAGEGDGSAEGSSRRIDSVGTDSAASLQQALTVSQGQKISHESHADIAVRMARHSIKFDTAMEN